jgi:hypothetical protein
MNEKETASSSGDKEVAPTADLFCVVHELSKRRFGRPVGTSAHNLMDPRVVTLSLCNPLYAGI